MLARAVDLLIGGLGSGPGLAASTALLLADVLAGWLTGWAALWWGLNGAVTGIVSIQLLFLVLHNENRSAAAMHVKLDMLILHDERMDDALVASEDLPAPALRRIKQQLLTERDAPPAS